MLVKKYSRHAIFALSLVSMLAIFSRCTSSSSGGSGSAATTFAISGNISVGQTAASMSSMSVNANAAPVVGEVHAQATQCSDGYYYNVYCVSYSEPPVAAVGAVSCSGSNSGSFTVAGLPLNAEIGCFVRRAATDTSSAYATIGTIEIPTTSLSGSTSTLVSQGDLNLSIDLNTDGSITTTVTGGGDNVVSPVESIDSVNLSQYTGFWSIQCDSSATGDLVNPIRCKCQNGGQELAEYQPGGSKNPNPGAVDPEQACMNDSAAEVSDADTQEFVEINMYTASPQSSLTIDDGIVIPAGTAVPIISVWSASSGSTSSRGSGGEGAATSVKDKNDVSVNLDWSSTQATNAISWTTAGTTTEDGITVDFAGSATALNTALSTPTAANWKTYVAYLYNNALTTGFTCTWGNSASGATDAGCLAEFSDRAIANNRQANIPAVRIHRNCDENGCDADVSHAYVHVDGYHADYSGIAPGGVTDAVTLESEGVSPQLRTRYVLEPFEATPSGGGFTQHHYNNRGYSCATDTSQQVQHAACTGTDFNFVHCGIREELSIKFKPSSSTSMKLFFEQRGVVAFARLEKWSLGSKTDGSFSDALEICEAENAASEARFQMTATKQ